MMISDNEATALWEILVPTERMDGTGYYRTRFHRVWDERVKDIAGGLTVISPVKGTWVSDEGETCKERMIPVRIRCSAEAMLNIALLTKKYYEQEAVLYCKVSDESYII